MSLPTYNTLLKRCEKELARYEQDKADFLKAAADNLEYALTWKEPQRAAVGIHAYHWMVTVLKDRKSGWTVEKLHARCRDRLVMLGVRCSETPNIVTEREFRVQELAIIANMFDENYGIFRDERA